MMGASSRGQDQRRPCRREPAPRLYIIECGKSAFSVLRDVWWKFFSGFV